MQFLRMYIVQTAWISYFTFEDHVVQGQWPSKFFLSISIFKKKISAHQYWCDIEFQEKDRKNSRLLPILLTPLVVQVVSICRTTLMCMLGASLYSVCHCCMYWRMYWWMDDYCRHAMEWQRSLQAVGCVVLVLWASSRRAFFVLTSAERWSVQGGAFNVSAWYHILIDIIIVLNVGVFPWYLITSCSTSDLVK